MKSIKISPYTPTDIEIEEISSNRAKISAFPFESGYAVTLAHPLRRLLLSSTVGCAPIAVKIEGASHEFDSIRGVMEDVALFIVNLKNVRFKLKEEIEKITIDYTFSGPMSIKGSDLENSDIEVVTPQNHVATINNDGVLKFSIVIYRGTKYVASEDIRDVVPEGYIPIDAFFTPVKKATYTIENVLVEDDPNFEKIIFDVTTDGQIDAITAFKNSMSVMYKQMSVFNNEFDISSMDADSKESDLPEIRNLTNKVESLNLSARSFNCLDRSNLKFIGELVLMAENELKEIKNLGKKSYEEITEKLEEIGYPVGGEIDEGLASALKKKIEKLKIS